MSGVIVASWEHLGATCVGTEPPVGVLVTVSVDLDEGHAERWGLVRPSGSRAEFREPRKVDVVHFTPDVPGFYEVRVLDGPSPHELLSVVLNAGGVVSPERYRRGLADGEFAAHMRASRGERSLTRKMIEDAIEAPWDLKSAVDAALRVVWDWGRENGALSARVDVLCGSIVKMLTVLHGEGRTRADAGLAAAAVVRGEGAIDCWNGTLGISVEVNPALTPLPGRVQHAVSQCDMPSSALPTISAVSRVITSGIPIAGLTASMRSALGLLGSLTPAEAERVGREVLGLHPEVSTPPPNVEYAPPEEDDSCRKS